MNGDADEYVHGVAVFRAGPWADHEPPSRCPACGRVQPEDGPEAHFDDCPLRPGELRLMALEARVASLEARAADAETVIENARAKLPPFLRSLLPPRR